MLSKKIMTPVGDVPNYLRDYGELYVSDPHKPSLEWLKNAKSSLFLYCSLFSYYGENCPYIFKMKMSIPEYKKTTEELGALTCPKCL